MGLQARIQSYQESHTHPVNRWLHSFGIPMIVLSLVVVFFSWRWALALFVLGWILQFLGHIFEGKPPVFLKNPSALLIGPLWVLKKFTGKSKDSSEIDPP